MSKTISIVINGDTRPGYLDRFSKCGSGRGCRSVDFMTTSIENKIKFFGGYDVEVTLYIDVHEPLDDQLMARIQKMFNDKKIHNLCLNHNTRLFRGQPIRQWHDIMYLNALMLARGEYVAHFDADAGAFRRPGCDIVDRFINWVDTDYDYVSYPTKWSPRENETDEFDYQWASTRFFFCRRETLNYNEILRCFGDQDGYIKKTYGDKPHRVNQMENTLGLIAGPGKIIFPPVEHDQYMIFTWHTYYTGTVAKLDQMPYDFVYDHMMNECGGICPPCDAHGVQL